MADLNTVVNSNDKKRLDLQQINGQWMIRAVQGHTISAIADEDLLTAISTDINQPENVFRYHEVFHGTYKHSLTRIMQAGLSRMKRNHIHMAAGLPGGGKVISGMRRSCEVAIEVNMTLACVAAKAGFFISKNKVILSPGLGRLGTLPPETFRSVFDVQSGRYTYQKPIDYLCIFDIQCNSSEKRGSIRFNEIISLPITIIDVQSKKVAGEFHTYVRPTMESDLTPFCTMLTGITNEMCYGKNQNGEFRQPTLKEAVRLLHNYFWDFGLFKTEFVMVSCGDFGATQLARESTLKKLALPNYLRRWINLKQVFPNPTTVPKVLKSDTFTTTGTVFTKN